MAVKEARLERQRIMMQIDQLQNKCVGCTKVKQGPNSRKEDVRFCKSSCEIGIEVFELGKKISRASLKGEQAVEIPKKMDFTKENYLQLKEAGVTDKAATKILGVGHEKLRKHKELWEMSKKSNNKSTHIQIKEELQTQLKQVTEERDWAKASERAADEELKKKKKQYAELFQQMQQLDQQLQEKDKLIQDFQKIAKEALEAIEYTTHITKQFDELQDLYMNRTDDKQQIIDRLSFRIAKLESLLLEYLPKGRVEWHLQTVKS